MVIKTTIIGYKKDATFGLRGTHDAGTATYAVGSLTKDVDIPKTKYTAVPLLQNDAFAPYDINYGKRETHLKLAYNVIEGHGQYYFWGDDTVAGAGPTYTHTLAGTAASTSLTLPSRLMHFEVSYDATVQYIDTCGCVVESQELSWSKDQAWLHCEESLLCQRVTDDSALAATTITGDGTAAATNMTDPVYITSGVLESDLFTLGAIKYGGSGGTSILGEIAALNIRKINNLQPAYTNRNTTDNYGNSMNTVPVQFYMKSRSFAITLMVEYNATTKTLFEKMHDQDKASDLYIQFTRSRGGQTETITYTASASYSVIEDITASLPPVIYSDGTRIATFVILPKNIAEVHTDQNSTAYDA